MEYTIAILSTISQSSAAMVAIIGGFLVSRFVSLSSEKEGLRRELSSTTQKLKLLKKEYEPVHSYRKSISEEYFYDLAFDDLTEIKAEYENFDELVKKHIPRGSTFEEIHPYALSLEARIQKAKNNIGKLLRDGDNDGLDIDDLKSRGLKFLPEDDEIYESIAVNIISLLPERSRSMFETPNFAFNNLTNPVVDQIQAKRFDEALAQESALQSQIALTETKAKRLEREYNVIGKPVGTSVGIALLIFLSLFGIVLPIILMGFEFVQMNIWIKWALILAFIIGLGSVLGYIMWYAKSLNKNTSQLKDN